MIKVCMAIIQGFTSPFSRKRDQVRVVGLWTPVRIASTVIVPMFILPLRSRKLEDPTKGFKTLNPKPRSLSLSWVHESPELPVKLFRV